MSIDISVVCDEKPNLEIAQRLALAILEGSQARGYAEMLFVFEPEPGQHEWGEAFPVMLTAPTREPESFIATLVYAHSLAVLFDGVISQDVDFFPKLTATEVFGICMMNLSRPSGEVWEMLNL